MEIQNPTTSEFVPLLGAFNFEYTRNGALGIPDEFIFRVDWTKEGKGQDILREHIRDRSILSVRQRSQQYQGRPKFESGINTPEGMVAVEVA